MLYVTWQMLKDGACCGTSVCAAGTTGSAAASSPSAAPAPAIPCSCAGRTRLAAVSILASDLTMAMENAIAVLSVLSEGGRVPDRLADGVDNVVVQAEFLVPGKRLTGKF